MATDHDEVRAKLQRTRLSFVVPILLQLTYFPKNSIALRYIFLYCCSPSYRRWSDSSRLLQCHSRFWFKRPWRPLGHLRFSIRRKFVCCRRRSSKISIVFTIFAYGIYIVLQWSYSTSGCLCRQFGYHLYARWGEW
jgi:hypothetical protein